MSLNSTRRQKEKAQKRLTELQEYIKALEQKEKAAEDAELIKSIRKNYSFDEFMQILSEINPDPAASEQTTENNDIERAENHNEEKQSD